jgi:hypothetical protein
MYKSMHGTPMYRDGLSRVEGMLLTKLPTEDINITLCSKG